MADACLRTGTHYLDITGEIDVFEALAARDAEAKRAGIMLLPGVGFDVVPSDCLALHLKQKPPDATDLKIYIGGLNALSHGTAKSMVEGVPLGLRVRRNGRITEPSPRPKQTTCDFGDGPTSTTVIPWGDVSTAYYSTRIPNIEVRMATTPPLRFAANLPGFARRIMGTRTVQSFLKARIDRMPEGPSEEVLRTGRRILVGVVTNAKGGTARATAEVRVAKRHLDKLDPARSPMVVYGQVEAHEAGLLFVDGKLSERLPSGRHAFWAVGRTVKIAKVDTRPTPLEVTAQEILTKDRVGIRVTLTAFTRVIDPEKAALAVGDVANTLYRLVQFAIREAVATRTLDEILAARDTIDREVRTFVTERAANLGVEIGQGIQADRPERVTARRQALG